MLSRRSRLKRAHRMEQYVEGICWCRWVARGFSCVPEARVQIPTELEGEKRSELARGTEREGGENRKPTGAEFASSKATSDYFIWLAARRVAFHSYKSTRKYILLSPFTLLFNSSSPHRHLSLCFSSFFISCLSFFRDFSFDLFLPFSTLSLSVSFEIVSNNKRSVIYRS